jgi:hypothetical protein
MKTNCDEKHKIKQEIMCIGKSCTRNDCDFFAKCNCVPRCKKCRYEDLPFCTNEAAWLENQK